MFILTRVVRIQILNKMTIFKYTNEKKTLIIHRCRIIHITKNKNDIQCAEMTKYWFRSDANSAKHGNENGYSIFIRLYFHFCIINDILYRQATSDEQVKRQPVLPSAHITTVREAMHNDMGRPGKDRTLSLLTGHEGALLLAMYGLRCGRVDFPLW